MAKPVLSGRVALVTGAGAGLGRAIAVGLAANQAKTVVFDRNRAGAEAVAVEINDRHGAGAAVPIAGDVSDQADTVAAVDACVEQFGRVDILVNNAGLGMDLIRKDLMRKPIAFQEVTLNHWRAILDVNLTGPFLMTRAVLPHFQACGAGRVVNVTTSFYTMMNVGFLPYGPTKAGLESATAILAKEFAGTGITFNVVVPGGPADTAMVPPESPFDRMDLIRPEAMVPPIVWLASDDGRGITGRRFIAANWNPDLPSEEAAAVAGAPAAWPQLADNVVWPGGEPET